MRARDGVRRAGRTACVRAIVLLPRNVTAPSFMQIAPPASCTRHRSGAGPPHARSRGADRRARQKATRRCARVGDRHAVEHELARGHEHRPAIHLHARGCRSARARYLVACAAATRVQEARPTRQAHPCAACGCRVCKQARVHAANLFNLLPVHKNCQLAITTTSQVLRPHTPAQTAVH